MKIRPVGAKLFHAEANVTKLTVACRIFGKLA